MRTLRVKVLFVLAACTMTAAGLAARATESTLIAGAAKQNMTPFTVIPGVTTPNANSDSAASNSDGLPGELWDTFEPESGLASAGQVTQSGIWGEAFTDTNANRRYDVGESFTDDPVNTRLDPGSANKWDGIYMPGFGQDRVPLGAFDPIWARALYVKDPTTGLAFAQASIDVIGWFSDWNDRIVATAKQMDPNLDLQYLIVSHTHDHEAVDTVGMWGADLTSDGKYPKYMRYIEYKIAQAVVDAAHAAAPAKFRFGEITPATKFTTVNGTPDESLAGLQSRNSCRTPWVFDDELRVMQVADVSTGNTIATLDNWGTHVESMEDNNVYLSSDFAHTIRSTIEDEFGGVAIHTQGAQAAAEVVGDSCMRRWHRDTFDGETFAVDPESGEPIVFKTSDLVGARNRTYALGRVAGSAAVRAIESAPWETPAAVDDFTAQDLFVPINNEGLVALTAAGVIDKPAYVGSTSATATAADLTGVRAGAPGGVDGKTTVYAWKIGSASFVTAPGELLPEIYWGLGSHNRATPVAPNDHFDYISPNPDALACAARPFSYENVRGANTGRAFEPGIRAAQVAKFGTAHNFLLGYTPDLLGYIVAGYDFAWYAAPPAHGVGLGSLHGAWGRDEAPDPCADIAPDLEFGVHYNNHYQETNSAGSMLAPAYACTVWEMLGLDPATSAEGKGACDDWHAWKTASLIHTRVDADVCDQSSDTDCVRHY
ncbi:MAG: hypothetical protein WDA27_02070 [Actinomycetota bacterium]